MQVKKNTKHIATYVTAFICSLCLFAILILLCNHDVNAAGGIGTNKKGNNCSVESVTLSIGGKETTFHGDLQPVSVPTDTDWVTYLSSIQITDYTIAVDDTCQKTHGQIYGTLNNSSNRLLTYANNRCYNLWSIKTMEQEMIDTYNACNYYILKVQTDHAAPITIYFVKNYAITWNLDGGAFPDGITPPTTYNLYNTFVLSYYPVKEGYRFDGWTKNEETTPNTNVYIYNDTSGDITLTAHWTPVENLKSIDSEAYTVTFSSDDLFYTGLPVTGHVTIYDTNYNTLQQGIDYMVTYKNNIEPAAAGSENPPTVIVQGIGAYTGTVTKTFTISKRAFEYHYICDIYRGEKLSSVDLNQLITVKYYDTIIEGTWVWKYPDTIADSNTEFEKCIATFTPTDSRHYKACESHITLNIRDRITDCTASLTGTATCTYTGKAHKPSVHVTDKDGNPLIENLEYTVSYVNNINAASPETANAPAVLIKGIGSYMGTLTLPFTIEPADCMVMAKPVTNTLVEGESLSASTLLYGVVKNSDNRILAGTFAWKDGNIVPTLADSDKTEYAIVFQPSDSSNYKPLTFTTTITVKPASTESTPDSNTGNTTQNTPDTDSGNTTQNTPDTDSIHVGAQVSDAKQAATYEVTATGCPEVAYIAPAKTSKSVTIPATVTLADGTTAKVTAIADGAFQNNTAIQTVTIGKNVTAIGKKAFSGCKKLKKIKGGSSVTTIGEKAFYNCTSLKQITIPETVKSIGKSAFQNCKKLRSITLQTTKLTKKRVGAKAFKGISAKALITTPAGKKKAYTSILKARGIGKKATIQIAK